ncbi:hypothetical protein [Kushneria sp. TE3]|uniref:hypothetical protein n=1 Tax=Kushneria sp. TE3 TaxID=3449832 RepID=UPI003F682E9D
MNGTRTFIVAGQHDSHVTGAARQAGFKRRSRSAGLLDISSLVRVEQNIAHFLDMELFLSNLLLKPNSCPFRGQAL